MSREFHIVRPDSLTSYQKKFLDDPARYAVMLAATKTGKTTMLIQWMLEQALQRSDGQECWWVAPVYQVSKIAFNRMKRYCLQIREQSKKQGFAFVFKANASGLSIDFINPNAGVMRFKSADKPDNLYGEDVHALVIDEATRMKRDAWTALRTTLTKTKGQARVIANVKGSNTWVDDLKDEANYSEDVSYYKITFEDAVNEGLHDIEELEDARKRLPRDDFEELYMCNPRDDASNPFKHNAIKSAIKPHPQTQPVFFGVDFARAVDYTVIIGLDYNGQMAYFDRFGASRDRFTYGEITDRVAHSIVDSYAVCDATGAGDVLLETLGTKITHNTVVDGFVFNNKSKVSLIDSLAVALQNGEIGLIDEPELIDEMRVFKSTLSPSGLTIYNAPEGKHDDCVIALALAWRCFTQFSSNQSYSNIIHVTQI